MNEPESLSGLLASKGRPVADATISWCPLQEAGLTDWGLSDLEMLRAQTRWARSDTSGRFGFEKRSDEWADSILWVTHPDFVASWISLTGSDLSAVSIDLDPAGRRSARVLDASGASVDATVEQRAVADPDASLLETRALEVFQRSYNGNELGGLATLPCTEVLWAEAAQGVSPRRIGPSEGDVTLTITGSFSASGTVTMAAGDPVTRGIRVRCLDSHPSEAHELAWTTVDPDGQWSIPSIPINVGSPYTFELNGEDIVRQTTPIASPAAGQSVRLDFVAERGTTLWFLVKDPDGNVLPGARARILWHGDDAVDSEDYTEHESFPARPDGYLRVPGVRPGSIIYDISCPGYAPARGGPVNVPEPELAAWTVYLTRAGVLRGRVVHGDRPVRSFTLLHSPVDRSDQTRLVQVRDAEDGGFELDPVPIGPLEIVACAEGLAQSEIVSVEIPLSRPAECVIHLADPVTGRGRIVDAGSESPIAGATVQLELSGKSGPMRPFGAVVSTDSDGWFELDGFSEFPTYFRATAPGYSVEIRQARGSLGSSLDLGVVALLRARPLEFALSAPSDPSTYSLSTWGREILPTRFPHDGILRFPSFTARSLEVVIEASDNSSYRFELDLPSTGEWHVPLDLRGDFSLRVEAEGIAGAEVPLEPTAVVRYRSSNLDLIRYSGMGDQGYTFRHMPPGDFVAEVIDSNADTLGAVRGTLRDRVETTVVIPIGPRRLLRVQHADGQPATGARLRFEAPTSTNFDIIETADDKGVLEVAGLPDENVFAHVWTRGGATYLGLPISPPSTEPTLIELSPPVDVDIQLTDSGVPAVGVQSQLCRPMARREVKVASSDDGGFVRWHFVGPGDYELHVTDSRYWPSKHAFSTESPPTAVRVWRRGSIELTVTRGAAAVPGASVELESDDFGEMVRSWLASGVVQASSQDLRTDAEGMLRVEGLPHGSYGAVVRHGDSVVEAVVTVPASSGGSATIALP